MELHPFHWESAVTDSHDLSSIRPCGNLQACGQARFLDDQRMIAGGGETLGEAAENSLVLVRIRTGFPVHGEWSPFGQSPRRVPLRLDAQGRLPAQEFSRSMLSSVLWREGLERGRRARRSQHNGAKRRHSSALFARPRTTMTSMPSI